MLDKRKEREKEEENIESPTPEHVEYVGKGIIAIMATVVLLMLFVFIAAFPG